MKTWEKGAIIGALWGIITLPAYLIIGYVFWEKDIPEIVSIFMDFLAFAPLIIIGFFFSEVSLAALQLQSKLIEIIFYNTLGWIFSGMIIFSIIQKYRTKRNNK
ncbi:MAG: hypothetical protein V1921_07370 [Candidatus Altiarchaeota archaeon]